MEKPSQHLKPISLRALAHIFILRQRFVSRRIAAHLLGRQEVKYIWSSDYLTTPTPPSAHKFCTS